MANQFGLAITEGTRLNTDAELVQRTLSGQKSAFELLVRRWSARVCAYTATRVRHVHTAEELAQEAFLKAFQALHRLDDPQKFGPWLLSIAHRLALDWLKAKSQTEVKMIDLDDSNSIEPKRQNPPNGPAEQCSKDEQTAILLTEINQLPSRLKEVLMIYYYDKVTYRQVAEMLGVSVATINARLTEARKILRERLSTLEGQS